MLNINMEFRKGILFVRLEGSLTATNINKFENEVIPIILSQEIKYVVINLDKLLTLDKSGVRSLIYLDEIVRNFNGKTTLCSLTSKEVKRQIHSYDLEKLFYETNNELTALGVMKIWWV